MRRLVMPALLLCALARANSAAAVVLDSQNGGQVLLFPFYSVDRDLQTLLSIENPTDRGKALRVRFVEGYNYREVLDFNLYLAPHDAWAGAVLSLRVDGPANLITRDQSCVAPLRLDGNPVLPSLPDGTSYASFKNYQYSGLHADAGPSGLDRTRVGAIEVIEMGTLQPGSPAALAAAHDASGAPHDCDDIRRRWQPGGIWTADPKRDLGNPTGGLSGTASLMNVGDGTMWTYKAVSLDEFRQDPTDQPRGTLSSVVLHGEPGSAHPNLSDALTDPAANLAEASVLIAGKIARIAYPADTRAVDAVSAVLMRSSLSNDYVIDAQLGAQSEWVVTFPTRVFYYYDPSDPASSLREPFAHGTLLEVQDFDREARVGRCDYVQFTGMRGCPTAADLRSAVNTIPFNQGHAPFINQSISAADASFLASRFSVELDPEPPADYGRASGVATLDLRNTAGVNRLPAALDGTTIEGLPVIGFVATKYVNAAARPGLLGNYTAIVEHHYTTRCSREGRACP